MTRGFEIRVETKNTAVGRSSLSSARATKEPLVITGDLVVPPTIMSWEREVLLPGVVPLVEALWRDAEKAEAEKERERSP